MKIKKILIVIGFFVIIYLLVFFILYAKYFDGIVSDYNAWTTFGTYYGGIMAPLFSFLSLIVVIYTFTHQLKIKREDDQDKRVLQLLDLLNRSYEIIYRYDYDFNNRYIEKDPNKLFNEQERFVMTVFRSYKEIDEYNKLSQDKKEERQMYGDTSPEHNVEHNLKKYHDGLKYIDGHLGTIYNIYKEINGLNKRAEYFDLLKGQITINVIRVFIIAYFVEINDDPDFQAFLMNIDRDIFNQYFEYAKNFHEIENEERFKLQ